MSSPANAFCKVPSVVALLNK